MPNSLWNWQSKEIEHALEPARALLWDPRTGKTRGTVECMKRAFEELGIRKFLVVAPSLAGSTTWPQTLIEAWPQANLTQMSGGSLKQRMTWLGNLCAEYANVPDVVVCNVEAIAPLYGALAAWGPEGIIVDEMHLIRSAGAKRTRALVRLGDRAKWRRGLTGTPVPRDYSNVYAQYRFLDASVFGTNQEAFRRRYIVSHPTWRNKVLGYLNLPELQEKMLSIASVVKRDQVFGKDGVQPPVTQDIILPPSVRRMYDQLRDDFVLEMEHSSYSFAHKLSRLNTLMQLASGFIYEPNGTTTWVHDAKINGLMEELEDYIEAEKPVVIFYHFDAEGERIEQKIRERVADDKLVARVAGAQTLEKRVFSLGGFDKPGGPRYLILQEQVGSLGISLAAASTCIFFSHSLAYDVHVQARDRIWKPGEEPLLHVYLRAPGTVDYFAKQIIERKESAEHMLLRPGSFESAAAGRTTESIKHAV